MLHIMISECDSLNDGSFWSYFVVLEIRFSEKVLELRFWSITKNKLAKLCVASIVSNSYKVFIEWNLCLTWKLSVLDLFLLG